MFVSIDMDNLVFLHKHHDHETISALSWLECGQTISVRVEPTDRQRFLAGVSDLDVRMLYKNSTGTALPVADAATLRHQLSDMVHLMGSTSALQHEVVAQVLAVEDRLFAGERFKYALGAMTPAQPGELFPLKARALTAQELEDAHKRAQVPVVTYKPRLTGDKPWEPRPEPGTEVATPETPVAAPVDKVSSARPTRQASVRPVVRAAADRAWDAAGRPTDPTVLKALTTSLIPSLEQQGYHPTTIRIKLSEWAKERIA